MKKLKIAIIGVGNISNLHIGAYLKNPECTLAAFCDINEKQLKAQGDKYGVNKLYTDYNQMLKEVSEINAVSVCTWNSEHAAATIAALNAGKHVLCEKPMAINAEQALAMQQAAEKSGKTLMIGFVRRFGNDCAIVEDFMNSDMIGDIYYAKAAYLRRNGCPGGWFGDKSRSGGGPLIDLGVHVIDLVRYLMGKPKAISVYAVTSDKLGARPNIKTVAKYTSVSAENGKDIFDVEDFASAVIRFENNAALYVETSFSLNLPSDTGKIEIFGTKGGIVLNPEFALYTETNGYLSDIKLAADTALSFDGLFENEINHFVDVIQHRTELRSSAEDGVEIMRILDAIYLSAQTAHEVLL